MPHVTDETLQEALLETLWSSLWSIWISSGSVSQKQTWVPAETVEQLQLVEKHPCGSVPVSTLKAEQNPTSVIGLLITFFFGPQLQWFQRSPRHCSSHTAIHVHGAVSTACTSMIASGSPAIRVPSRLRVPPRSSWFCAYSCHIDHHFQKVARVTFGINGGIVLNNLWQISTAEKRAGGPLLPASHSVHWTRLPLEDPVSVAVLFCLVFWSKTSPHYDSFTTLKFCCSKSFQYFWPWLLLWPAHICSLSNLFDFVHGHPTLQASQPDELTIEEHEVLEVIEDGDMEDWVKVYSFAHITPSCDVSGIYFGSWYALSKLCV